MRQSQFSLREYLQYEGVMIFNGSGVYVPTNEELRLVYGPTVKKILRIYIDYFYLGKWLRKKRKVYRI